LLARIILHSWLVQNRPLIRTAVSAVREGDESPGTLATPFSYSLGIISCRVDCVKKWGLIFTLKVDVVVATSWRG